ncbi:hypothetical protein QQF64_010750 [Cirrhinus molitorella]|uniref:Uncharacterized protein n=1 Tax=Cirrhinus molitorella TaxID=172907 RepID=A0ABR3LZQ0_9TELE
MSKPVSEERRTEERDHGFPQPFRTVQQGHYECDAEAASTTPQLHQQQEVAWLIKNCPRLAAYPQRRRERERERERQQEEGEVSSSSAQSRCVFTRKDPPPALFCFPEEIKDS